MKEIKKLVVCAVVGAMLLSLVGCAKKESTAYDSGKSQSYKMTSAAYNTVNEEPVLYSYKTDYDGFDYAEGVASYALDASMQQEAWNTEEYNEVRENSFEKVTTSPLSTFAIDVDNGSYTNYRHMVYSGRSISNIPSGAIRTEEFLNYFDYSMAGEQSDGRFSVKSEIHPCPWNPENGLLSLLVTANPVNIESKGNNFVFLIDSSGSMGWAADASKVPIDMAIDSFSMMVEQLTESDRVSIVTYAGSSATLLDGCSGADHKTIRKVLKSISTEGGTNGSGGITAAYECAMKNFIEGGNNRVILASDGDMNLGITSQSGLIDLITEKKESGVFLTTLGFGEGNYSDANMERIADAGNGNYFYIDCADEARRVLVEKLLETTITVAKDVKLQAEFNPEFVSEYRLIGYENRTMADADFSDDTKDGGEVGAGTQVMVLYEIKYANGEEEGASELKYQTSASTGNTTDLLTMSIRYKEPDGDVSTLEQYPVIRDSEDSVPSSDWYFVCGIAEFTGLMHNSSYFPGITYMDAVNLIKEGTNQNSYREEFVILASYML